VYPGTDNRPTWIISIYFSERISSLFSVAVFQHQVKQGSVSFPMMKFSADERHYGGLSRSKSQQRLFGAELQ
jgi:hypothetical protein